MSCLVPYFHTTSPKPRKRSVLEVDRECKTYSHIHISIEPENSSVGILRRLHSDVMEKRRIPRGIWVEVTRKHTISSHFIEMASKRLNLSKWITVTDPSSLDKTLYSCRFNWFGTLVIQISGKLWNVRDAILFPLSASNFFKRKTHMEIRPQFKSWRFSYM